MMSMKTGQPTNLPPVNGHGHGVGGGGEGGGAEWEVRPGGMLVQKRNPDSDRTSIPPPTIRVRVKYGSTYHEVNVSSQASFGELKKILAGRTGLHHEDQKLFFKGKERDSKAFLDTSGAKDKSKIVLMEDPISQEKRMLEMRKTAKMEKASKSISEISLEVDRLGGQVSALESIISKGGKVPEKNVVSLIELLMNQLLKLDGITADGDVKLQRKLQVRRVQKYVETLDVLKVKNSVPSGEESQKPNSKPNGNGSNVPVHHQRKHSNGPRLAPIQEHQPRHSDGERYKPTQENHQPSRHSTGGVVVTTQWETFDSAPTAPSAPLTSTSTATATNSQPMFPWDFFN